MALLTLPSVGRCGAVFAFASWADVAIVTLPTRTLLKSLRFVVVFLRPSFKREGGSEEARKLLVTDSGKASWRRLSLVIVLI